jgi:Ca2+-binding RTX toxin-like protein
MAAIGGTAGDDLRNGTADGDQFKGFQGGDDTLNGLAGTDRFQMGAAFTAADHIDGGAHQDTLLLDGDYSAGVTFTATTVTNVEILTAASGHSYNLVLHDATVAAGQTLRITGASLSGAHQLTVDGSAEADGRLVLVGGSGADSLTGGGGKDTFDLTGGGNDTAIGGAGADRFYCAFQLGESGRVIGGDGVDLVFAAGGLNADNFREVETLTITGDTIFRPGDGTVAAGKTFKVVVDEGYLQLFGAAEADGRFRVTASDAQDTLEGGARSDNLNGGAGTDYLAGLRGNDVLQGGFGYRDALDGGAGADIFVYDSAAESTGDGCDVLIDVDIDKDRFMAPVTVTGVAGEFFGSVDFASFDADLAAIEASPATANEAWIVHINGGDMWGQDCLIVDLDGSGAYEVNQDLLLRIGWSAGGFQYTGTLEVTDFVVG